MAKRFVSVWFPYLLTDDHNIRHAGHNNTPFVIAAKEKGKVKVKGTNEAARRLQIHTGMVVADCRAILPGLEVADYPEGREKDILQELALWCLRYTPEAAADEPAGLLLDATGCPHLWGGEQAYLQDILEKLKQKGFTASIAIADTIGMAWAAARYLPSPAIIAGNAESQSLAGLPSAALRLPADITARLDKLGLYRIGDFIHMPREALRKRFGPEIALKLDQATGREREYLQPVAPPVYYQQRLPCFEPIITATGIETALKQLLSNLCKKLLEDTKGLRTVVLKCYRVDGNLQQIMAGTHQPARDSRHLFKLLELKISSIEPALGFELFVLEAPVTEEMPVEQESFWGNTGQDDDALNGLLDRISNRIGEGHIHRYLPQAHYWPERAMKATGSLREQPDMAWPSHLQRPVQLLKEPVPIEVAVPVPDYPPLLFIFQGRVHKVRKADGPERIEQEWWLQQGLFRDYYCAEDETGARYWLFRLGHYDDTESRWFLHGFFA